MLHPDENEISRFVEGSLSLVQRERVEQHCAVCPECRSVIAELTLSRSQAHRPNSEGQTPELGQNPSSQRYVLQDRLGAGTMGVVYAAYDRELQRRVALKLVRLASLPLPAPEARTLLLREAHALARVSHPNVVTIFDVGALPTEAGDAVYLAMELVEGQTLKDWLRAGPRRTREILKAFVEAGRGLNAVHRAGLVHRDFKPENILVGADGRPRLADFGLARLPTSPEVREKAPATVESPESTYSGARVGTPAYMSPEQLAGRRADIRSDVFSFCVALYEALAGVRPFVGRTPEELERALKAERLAGASGTRRIPIRVRRWLVRGLRYDADARWPSLEPLLTLLTRELGRTRRILLTSALLAAVAVPVAVGWAMNERHRCDDGAAALMGIWDPPRREQLQAAFQKRLELGQFIRGVLDQYAQRWTEGYQDACRATWVRGDQSQAVLDLRMLCLAQKKAHLRAVVEQLSTADESALAKAVDVTQGLVNVAECSNLEALRQQTPPPSDTRVRAELELLLESMSRLRVLRDSGKAADAQRELEQLLPRVTAVGYPPLAAKYLELRGTLKAHQGAYSQAEEDFLSAVRESELGRDDPARAHALAQLFAVTFTLERREQAAIWSQLAESAMGRLQRAEPGSANELELELLQFQGHFLWSQRRYDAALVKLRRAVELSTTVYGPNDPMTGVATEVLARYLTNLRRFREAEPLARRALALYEPAPRADVLTTTLIRITLGRALSGIGRYEDALQTWGRVPDEFKASHAKTPIAAAVLANEAMVLRILGRTAEAHARFERALDAMRTSVGASNSLTLTLEGMFAVLLTDENARAQAEGIARRMLESAVKQNNPLLAGEAHVLLARNAFNAGKVELARTEYREALARYEDPALKGLRVRSQVELGNVEQARNDARAAEALEREVLQWEAEGLEMTDLDRGEARLTLACALWRSRQAPDEAQTLAKQAIPLLHRARWIGEQVLRSHAKELARHGIQVTSE
ncbi:MAG: protein kinase domain-containing protein [Myxococcaceae bacterium]